jgi:hypothetical protein
MKLSAIETWALRVVEQIHKGGQPEGDTVELKAEWPDPIKAARRLAAHANAARGENILWLIGVDEHKGVVGAPKQELSVWFSQIESHFDHVVPTMQAVPMSWQDTSFTALCFQTDRAPYVVKNPLFGQTKGEVKWEVPWREGASTRTASRNELLLILSEFQRLPKIEVLEGDVRFKSDAQNLKNPNVFSLSMTLYVTPPSGAILVFPFHRITLEILAQAKSIAEVPFSVSLRSATRKRTEFGHATVTSGSEVLEATADDITIRGPARISATVECHPIEKGDLPLTDIQIHLTLVETVSDTKVPIVCAGVLPNPELRPLVWKLTPIG